MTQATYPRPATLTREQYAQTAGGRMAVVRWIKQFNNCFVRSVNGSFVAIKATSFVAQAISRQGGFNVYQTNEGWIVDLNRKGLQII